MIRKCPWCEHICFNKFCPKCGNNLDYKTLVSEKVSKKRKDKLNKVLRKYDRVLGK